MASKADFTNEEWSQLIESAMLASIAVTAAEPSGLWGTLQEGFANATGLVGARSSDTPLIKDIVAALGTSEGRSIAKDAIKTRLKGAQADDVARSSIAAIAAVTKVVDAKAGADAGPFKAWIYANAQRVAEASTEGGFLGFGGEKVSAKERATLADLSAALGLPPR
jgi:hypothetical protein